LDEQLRARGSSLASVEIHKLRRALDAVLVRPEVDARRVAMAGLSCGGFYTSYLMALEPRIGAGAASCSMRLLPEPGAAGDLAAPRPSGRLAFLPLDDLMALIAPRPFQIQSGIDDPLLPIAGARTLAARGRLYWAGLGAEDRFPFEAFAGKHEFNGDLAWKFLARYLEPSATASEKPKRAPVRR
jgi:predicted esterase